MFTKRLLLIYFSGLCLIPINLFAQSSGWLVQESGTDKQLRDVYFVNADAGWIAGTGCILKTTNGGLEWQVQDSSDYEFWAIHFTDANNGYTVGYRSADYQGFIYQTNDGGQNWYIKDSSNYQLYDICFVDSDTGFAVGGGRSHTTILKTTDGGGNWEIIFDAYGGNLYTVDFVGLQTGWAAGEGGRISKTMDGFKEMESNSLNLGAINNFWDIQFINQDTGWVMGDQYLFKTTDGGENWQSMEALPDYSYKGCFFKNNNSGWMGANVPNTENRKILFTPDGGITWEVQDSTLIGAPFSIFFIDDHKGWLVGYNGMIMATTNGGVVNIDGKNISQDELPQQFMLAQNYPNPFNPVTTIKYALPKKANVLLEVYNIAGQRMATLVDAPMSAGFHEVQFKTKNLPSGLYIYRIYTNEFQHVKKMVLVK